MKTAPNTTPPVQRPSSTSEHAAAASPDPARAAQKVAAAKVASIDAGARQSMIPVTSRNANERIRSRIETSPMQPARLPRKYWSRVGPSAAKEPSFIWLSTVADETASSGAASFHAPIAAPKLISMKPRPVSAGLNTLDPMPPNIPLATTMATTAPMTTIQRGTSEESTSASRTPVTAAERFPMVFFCFVTFWKQYSARTQLATETSSTSRAL